ncbi:increased DNA methylation 1 isoform X2 [Olea europaea var. sylvestris]|uniref:increased DNA methylation 1 isoform X2 n=1 Tax=Olea europaea var. sylvestris TaxID=158386 RepID=UPI000C1D400D|nr:increased DNA methylation 1 isoform X2 [Olea europaea var. sylvestris]
MEKKWSASELRTVLSWLIHLGVVSLNEVIQSRNLKNDVVKDGLITRNGILCNCCNTVLSISGFKSHAGFGLKQNCIGLFLESDKPLTSCQLEAWSAEYKARKARTGQVDETDPNDDCCGRCGDVGQLICCDSCPSAFHLACLFEQVYSGLQSRIGLINRLSDGYSWTLLKCINGEPKVHSDKCFVTLKAECNSKLAVAITILEECFLSMVDPKTGINMIPQVMYNWGSEFARLNYSGFYTVVLEKDDIVLSVASIRIHGVTVAELPLVATCSKYRRKGLCRLLINSIEEMLKSLKVKKLIVSAVPSVVETWTKGFGFEPLEDDEKQSLSRINLMVFPGSVWLKKPLYQNAIDQEKETTHIETGSTDEPEGMRLRSGFVCSRSQNRHRNQKWR